MVNLAWHAVRHLTNPKTSVAILGRVCQLESFLTNTDDMQWESDANDTSTEILPCALKWLASGVDR
jgi:hypothetical protein